MESTPSTLVLLSGPFDTEIATSISHHGHLTGLSTFEDGNTRLFFPRHSFRHLAWSEGLRPLNIMETQDFQSEGLMTHPTLFSRGPKNQQVGYTKSWNWHRLGSGQSQRGAPGDVHQGIDRTVFRVLKMLVWESCQKKAKAAAMHLFEVHHTSFWGVPHFETARRVDLFLGSSSDPFGGDRTRWKASQHPFG